MRGVKTWRSCHVCKSECHYELNGAGDDLRFVGPDCSYCDGKREVLDLFDRLASNLATAAALCRAFDLGHRWCCAYERLDDDCWHPGCQREAP